MSTPARSPALDRTRPSNSDPAAERVMSVDALRGFDMFWILGADEVGYALHKSSQSGWIHAVTQQLEHKEWGGFTFYDLIFPLFVFLVGVSLVFSLTKALREHGRRGAYLRVVRRSIILFIIALIYSGGIARGWEEIRWLGVLNRIALCYFFAGVIFCHFRWKGVAIISATLLLGYWALMSTVPFADLRPVTPAGALVSTDMTATNVAQLNWASTNQLRGVYEPGLNLANYVDQKYLPGRKWDKTWDPEGLLSTLPAVATCLLGVLAGLLLQNGNVRPQRKVVYLAAAGVGSVLLGFLWGLHFPVIKKIWTSSYVLVAGGYSALLLAVFYQVIDIWRVRRWALPFVWIGANAITLYLVNNIIDLGKLSQRLVGGEVRTFFDSAVATGAGDILIAAVALGIAVLLAWFLYRRRIFLRI